MNKQKKFAIVDIETTGNYAGGSRITEIAIIIVNGNKISDQYHTLVNPQIPIPLAIQSLTGISNSMVENAPVFSEIAEDIYHFLQGKVFVAHNVSFDYSFIQRELKEAGYEWQALKLCTVRLSRKIFPGYPSYSLGNICKHFDITIIGRHRALGDAKATVELFNLLYKNDKQNYIFESLQKNTEHRLPTHLSLKEFNQLPESPGIYLFLNKKGKIIYVGKAINIKKRVLSHFTGTNITLRRQQFINDISNIDFSESGTELMALLMECQMIKKHWPVHNRALKKYEPKYALIHYLDSRGYDRLAVIKTHSHAEALSYFETVTEANQNLTALLNQFDLSPNLCTFYSPSTLTREDRLLTGANLPSFTEYQLKITKLFEYIRDSKQSYLIIDRGRNEHENSYVYFKEDKLFAFGFFDNTQQWQNVEDIVSYRDKCVSNFYMQYIVKQYAQNHPNKVFALTSEEA